MTNRPNLTEEEKEHYYKVAMDKILESISEHIQDTIGNAYDLFAEGTITRQKYIDFLLLQAKMLNKEAEGHKEFMDKLDILKKLESKTKYLIPYCFECGAEYEDQSCCPDKLISYIHPSFLKKLKEKKFGVHQFKP